MTELNLETPDCPLCGCPERKQLYPPSNGKPFGVCACEQCGLAYLAPRLPEQEMLSLYQDDDYFGRDDGEGYTNYSEQEDALRRTFRRVLAHLAAQGRTGGSLLEIGCGFGYLLDEARPYFTRRCGTDYSANAVRSARQMATKVWQGGVDSVPESEQFDCVIATHVVEHVYHPRAFIESLARRLKPGGSMLVAAPDFGSFWRKLMGNRWPSFKFPEHVLYFDGTSLSRLMEESGLSSVQVVPYAHAFPLPLIAAKFGIELPSSLGRHSLWLPATTIACVGVNHASA
ncbi:class I SAM-dependent methyltransferase [Caballeronia sp. J97]|uniref:class I SAM-dependent methyltransferase n=1 Tax=Caballeronia sp. J97 TaxID=2805429 RepID=UPI002AB29397|nr:class I SAM-dependent methyltransferase [Caballeronia sp. J97]